MSILTTGKSRGERGHQALLTPPAGSVVDPTAGELDDRMRGPHRFHAPLPRSSSVSAQPIAWPQWQAPKGDGLAVARSIDLAELIDEPARARRCTFPADESV